MRIRAIADAVHLIEPKGPSVRLTTLTECKERKWKNGYETCVRFAARRGAERCRGRRVRIVES